MTTVEANIAQCFAAIAADMEDPKSVRVMRSVRRSTFSDVRVDSAQWPEVAAELYLITQTDHRDQVIQYMLAQLPTAESRFAVFEHLDRLSDQVPLEMSHYYADVMSTICSTCINSMPAGEKIRPFSHEMKMLKSMMNRAISHPSRSHQHAALTSLGDVSRTTVSRFQEVSTTIYPLLKHIARLSPTGSSAHRYANKTADILRQECYRSKKARTPIYVAAKLARTREVKAAG